MFRCALAEFDELELSFVTNGTRHVVQLPIGYDDETLCRYSLFVSLAEVPGYGNGTSELIFCILEYDPAIDHTYDIWDSAAIRHKVPNADHRKAILLAICQGVECLIDEATPNVVTMVTYTPHLPAKALTKYHAVLQTIEHKGYKVGKSDVWNGSHTWMMERQI